MSGDSTGANGCPRDVGPGKCELQVMLQAPPETLCRVSGRDVAARYLPGGNARKTERFARLAPRESPSPTDWIDDMEGTNMATDRKLRGWPVLDTCNGCDEPVKLIAVWTSDGDATYVHTDPIDPNEPELCGGVNETASTDRRDLVFHG